KYGHKEDACRAKNPKLGTTPQPKFKANVVDTKVKVPVATTQLEPGESSDKKVSSNEGWSTPSNIVQQKKRVV
ncbi:hypothetical protein HAX54_000707, partial [Datura stramonium]|nr:hypothetical protein [Datura stramonium]